MAIFTNYATLSYNGGTINSNTVTGEILESFAVTKTAVMNDYTAKDDVTYVITLVNNGMSVVTDISLTDDLGGYPFRETTVYPLEYTNGSVRYYVNGVLQSAPAVTAGPPMVISGISIPAGGNVMLIYEATVTNFAPLGTDDIIVNTVSVNGNNFSAPFSATETIETENRVDLTVSKAVCPGVVTESGELTYTFVIANVGNTAAVATDNLVLTDTFDPVLNPITVTFNGTVWTEGVQYTYDPATGAFATLPGQITVPAATYTQLEDGTWATTPGTATLTVSGTVAP